MEETARSLIEFIERASPVIWEAGRTEVISSIARSMVWLLLVAVGLYLFGRVVKNWWSGLDERGRSDDDNQILFCASMLLIICGIVIMAVLLTGALSRIINPDYYAIRYITYLWPGAS